MTTTVTVKARAHGATVETNGETVEVAPNTQRDFHISEGSQSFSVTQPAEAPASEGFVDEATGTDSSQVPGREQNDQLTGQGAGKQRRPQAPTGNQSGAGAADQQV